MDKREKPLGIQSLVSMTREKKVLLALLSVDVTKILCSVTKQII